MFKTQDISHFLCKVDILEIQCFHPWRRRDGGPLAAL